MRRFPCPILGGDVELTGEREAHIRERHPDLLPVQVAELARAIGEPDYVSPQGPTRHVFTSWAGTIRDGRYVVVVVSTDAASDRHWIVTAYLSRARPREA